MHEFMIYCVRPSRVACASTGASDITFRKISGSEIHNSNSALHDDVTLTSQNRWTSFYIRSYSLAILPPADLHDSTRTHRPGNPYDGHTLASVIPAITQQIGASLTRVIADAGYRGHKAPRVKGMRVYTSGQKRGVTTQIKRDLRRRPAVEPVIGHLKEGHRMGRNYLAGREGDATNAILAAVGYNFRLLLIWLAEGWCARLLFVLSDRQTSVSSASVV